MTVTTINREDAPAVESEYVNPLDVMGTDTSSATDAEDALKVAGLAGWQVHLRQIQTVQDEIRTDEEGNLISAAHYDEVLPVKDTFAVVRTNPKTGQFQTIGTVGNRYEVLQNEELADFLNDLVYQSGGKISRAGDYYGDGKRFFLSLDLPQSVLIGGRDLVNHSINLFSSHDGSVAVTPVISSMRIFCQNQRNAAISSGIASTRIRHTASAISRLQVVRNILGIAQKETEKFAEKAEVMASAKISDETFWEIVADIWEPADPRSVRAQGIQRNRLHSIAGRLHGAESENIKGTAWAAYNAVTSHLQHSNDSAKVNAHRAMSAASAQKSAALAEKLFHQYALANV